MTVGKRLKEERLRLRLSQEAFGAAGGVGKSAQINYERDEDDPRLRYPDSLYLEGVASTGADLLYILTGKRRLDMAHTEAERLLLQQATDRVHGTGDIADPHRLEEAYNNLYDKAVAAGKTPGAKLTNRHANLIKNFDDATEPGRKMIERVAELEAARSAPQTKTRAKVSAKNVEIRGDGNVIGNSNKTTTNKR